jgi:outer membrane protein insertion porin family
LVSHQRLLIDVPLELIHAQVAAFADAGSLWNFTGPTTFPATGEVISGSICPTFGPGIPNAVPHPIDNAMHVRSSVGVGLIWES